MTIAQRYCKYVQVFDLRLDTYTNAKIKVLSVANSIGSSLNSLGSGLLTIDSKLPFLATFRLPQKPFSWNYLSFGITPLLFRNYPFPLLRMTPCSSFQRLAIRQKTTDASVGKDYSVMIYSP
jgi:hypothetical protein